MTKNKVDLFFLIIVISLISAGFLIFMSASLSLLARESNIFQSVIFNQLFLGLFIGGIAAFVASKIPYRFWRVYSPWIFFSAVILTLLVFIPGIGLELKGAHRWLTLGSFTFQPSEFLKIAYVIYLAGWLSRFKNKINTFKYGALPFLLVTAIASGILFIQPDTDNAIILALTGLVMYFIAGANLKHFIGAGIIVIIIAGGIIVSRPYIVDRFLTFFDPSADALNSGYQIQQSLIAIGSGGATGRGFGQSIQKFNFLPEPIGDSIFAVAAEEFGFIGSFILVVLFSLFLIRGSYIALNTKENYGSLVFFGLLILIVGQSFSNIASMLGLIPLIGLPLLFVSHGGTALFFTLLSAGIMLNISKFKKS